MAQTAEAHPKFIVFTGDLVLRGDDAADWETWDTETKPWAAADVKVYPAIGNHELHADPVVGLRNYFVRFPELAGSRYYSLRAGNTLTLVLDSALPEVSGPQGEWLVRQLNSLPQDLDFVFVVLHHPPYTNSKDRLLGGGHGPRPQEQALAALLEQHQAQSRARFVVFSGHVHNYERYEHHGVTYIVSGGGGATPYTIPRGPADAYRGTGTTYHYCQVEVNGPKLTIRAMKLELGEDGKQTGFHEVDSVTLSPAAKAKAAAAH